MRHEIGEIIPYGNLPTMQGQIMRNAIEGFKQAMRDAGVQPPTEIIADSVLHRFTVTGDKARSKNGWYIFHADDPAAGAFGCWKRNLSGTWCSKTYQTMTSTEKAAYSVQMEVMKRLREEEREIIHSECRKKSAELWQIAHDVDARHPYVIAKQITPYGAKQLNESLLLPVRDAGGILHGLQFIMPDGTKVFKTGTTVTGCYFSIGKPNWKCQPKIDHL